MNFGFNSKCRGRKHSLFHWNILMLQGRLTLIWMCYKRSELTIIGMSIRADIRLILEKDSQNSLCWQKNFQKEKCGPEGDWQRSKELPDLIMCGQKFGKIGKAVENREKQEGARGKPKLDNALRLRGIYLYWCRRQRILWSSWKRKKKTGKNCGSRDAVKKDIQASWKRAQSRRLAMKKSLKQCLIVLWNLMNLWDNEQNLCSLKTVRITLQVKDLLLWHSTIWCTSFFPCHKRWKFRMQKLPWTRNEWKKLETVPAWDLEKVKSKKEVILEAQRDEKQVHFATLIDMCHIKNAELESKISKINRQSRAPRWHIVKDGSGAYAVFTERGSSASQMTAVKKWMLLQDYQVVMDKQLMQYQRTTRYKLEDAPSLLKIHRIRMSWCLDTSSTTHKWSKSCESIEDLVVFLERQCVRSSIGRIAMGKDNSKKLFYQNLDGRKFRLGTVTSLIGNWGYFCQFLWMTSKWL